MNFKYESENNQENIVLKNNSQIQKKIVIYKL